MPVFDQHLAYSYFKKKSLTSIRRLRAHTNREEKGKRKEKMSGGSSRYITHPQSIDLIFLL
jgi:hypothetical protein